VSGAILESVTSISHHHYILIVHPAGCMVSICPRTRNLSVSSCQVTTSPTTAHFGRWPRRFHALQDRDLSGRVIPRTKSVLAMSHSFHRRVQSRRCFGKWIFFERILLNTAGKTYPDGSPVGGFHPPITALQTAGWAATVVFPPR
jgi:hypothetical protein